jgi:hypothetical protein
MTMATIPLCTLKDGGFKHAWRFVSMVVADVGMGSSHRVGLWQCNDCQHVETGRTLTGEETKRLLAEGPGSVVVMDLKVPL